MTSYLRKKSSGTISIGTTKDVAMLLWIAEQKGFLSDQNLRVSFKYVPYTRKAMDLLIDGKVDCAVFVETNVAYLGYLKPKIPIKCLASLERRMSDNMLVRHDENGSIKPDELHGKTIAFMPRTTSHSFLMRFLEEHKIRKRDVILKPLSPQVMPDALMREEVDAISCWQPYINNAMLAMDELGMHYTRFNNTGFYASEVVIGTSKPFLVKHTKELERLLRALRKAEEFMKENPAEVIPLLSHKLKIAGSAPEKVLQEFEPEIRPIGDEYMRNIDLLSAWINENDTEFKGQTPPDYADFIDNSLFFDTFGKNQV